MENNQLSDKITKHINPGLDIRHLMGSILSRWYWFVLCLLITLLSGYLYLRYTTPWYSVKGLVLIDQKENSAASSILNKFTERKDAGQGANLFNEMSMMTSQDLVGMVVDSLDLHIQYFTKGRIKEEEIYETTPLYIQFDTAGFIGDYTEEIIVKEIVDGLFELRYKDMAERVMYDSWIEKPFGRFKILYNDNPSVNKGYLTNHTEIIIRTEPFRYGVNRVLTKLHVKISDGRSSLLDVRYTDNLPRRGIAFMNVLLYFYRKKELEDINLSAEKTREFISMKKKEFISELQLRDSLEQEIKIKNDIVDVQTQVTSFLSEKTQEQQKIYALTVSRKSVEQLKKNILEGVGEREEVMAGLSVSDPYLEQLVAEYNMLIQQKENLERNTGALHPSLIKIKNDIAAQRKQIADACDRVVASIDISLGNASRNVAASSQRIQSLPSAERSINDTKREYPLIQSVYLYIYQRDMENDIAQYAATNKAKVIVAPYKEEQQLKPVGKNVYLAMIILGIIVPGSIIVGRVLLNNKVANESHIENMTSIPIIGTIFEADNDGKHIVVGPHIRTGIAEQFRLIRANLEFMGSSAHAKKTYLITSSMSGEGKTFISLNLGITMTLAKKRVIVMEFDLRKPKISSYLGIKNEGGISAYLAGLTGIENVIKPSGVHDNLYVANCGPIPPNPGELLVLPTAKQLMDELYEMFDIIIMDTAPIGLVSDALILSHYSDINMFVVRQNYTIKEQVRLFDILYKENKIRNPAIIFNGVRHLKKYGYGYGGYYGYGYGYGDSGNYYSDSQKHKRRNLIDILFRK